MSLKNKPRACPGILLLASAWLCSMVLFVVGALFSMATLIVLASFCYSLLAPHSTPGMTPRLRSLILLLLAWPIAVPILLIALTTPGIALRNKRYASLAIVLLSLFIIDFIAPQNWGKTLAIEQDSPMIEATTQVEKRDQVLDYLNGFPYTPAWWLKNPHAQSFYGPFFRNKTYNEFRSERLETPDDDFVMLQYADADPDKPLVLMLHGLEGSAQSFYIKTYNEVFHAQGWNTVTLEFRYCSGEINKTKRIYHMGETTDIDHVIKTLTTRHPDKPLFLLGISLGANVLTKWLGETSAALPEQIQAAAVIAPPFMPHKSVPAFHDALGGFYVWHFLRSLKPKARAKAAQFPGAIDLEALEACKDFYTYDTIITAKLHGFDDAMDYWEKVGSYQFLPDIQCPTLLVAAKDDPFNPEDTIPYDIAAANPWLHPQWADQGGHVGFVAGPTPRRAYSWAEEQTMRFFQHYAN